MMSSYGANPIFFNKKIKIGCPERPESGRHICITPKKKKLNEISAKFQRNFANYNKPVSAHF